jgi:tubulin--tyrosine ligase
MADRGMGIRLFTSKDGLQHIFEEFEGDLDSEDETDGTVEIDSNTTVITSQIAAFCCPS